jgi:hypothetical protein
MAALPLSEMAKQRVFVGHDTDVRVPPAPTDWGLDHFPACQKRAKPLSSTAAQKVVVGHDTPYRDEGRPLGWTWTGADQVAPPLTEPEAALYPDATIMVTATTSTPARKLILCL